MLFIKKHINLSKKKKFNLETSFEKLLARNSIKKLEVSHGVNFGGFSANVAPNDFQLPNLPLAGFSDSNVNFYPKTCSFFPGFDLFSRKTIFVRFKNLTRELYNYCIETFRKSVSQKCLITS